MNNHLQKFVNNFQFVNNHCLDFVVTYVGVLTDGKLATSRVCGPSLKYKLVFVTTFT